MVSLISIRFSSSMLKILSKDENHIGCEGCDILVKNLKQNQNLSSLNLGLFHFIFKNNSESLNPISFFLFKDNGGIGSSGLKNLCSNALKFKESLTSLHLGNYSHSFDSWWDQFCSNWFLFLKTIMILELKIAKFWMNCCSKNQKLLIYT